MRITVDCYAQDVETAAKAIAKALESLTLADPPATAPIIVNGQEAGRIAME